MGYTHPMNNILIGLVAVVVIGGGAYVALQKMGSGEEKASENMALEQSAGEQAATRGTFAQLMLSGQPLECTFEHDDGTNKSSGTVYMANGGERLRGDFTIEQSGAGPMEAHMVRDGGYNYIWGSFYPQGVKAAVTLENKDKLFEEKDGTSTIDEDTSFECRPWSVNASAFALPSDVEFLDIAAQMETMMKTQGVSCSMCDQAPAGAAREQCLMALGCN